MAEILLSLTIIGVVAAITLPSLTGNINERTWNTQRKALYARMSQAVSLMPALNGYGTFTPAVEANSEAGISAKDAVDTVAETFVTEGLSKVLKINNVCDAEHLSDCGLPDKITPLSGSSTVNLADIKTIRGFNSLFTSSAGIPNDLKAAAFETVNGESIIVYYNYSCVGNMNENKSHYTPPKMCANLVYDLNGKKGPNTLGKDVGFISVLYPTDSVVVAPAPVTSQTLYVPQKNIAQACTNQSSDSRAPSIDELTAMFYNNKLLGLSKSRYYLSGSVISNSNAWGMNISDGTRFPYTRTVSDYVRCVKR